MTRSLCTLITLISLVAAADQQAPTEVFGLFIGIDEYPLKPLPNCVNDANDMRAHLLSSGVPEKNLKLLLNRDATRQGILDALDWLVKVSGPNTECHIYYSGHGSRRRDQNGDEPDNFDETWVACDLRHVVDDEIEARFAKMKGRVIVISDSCHSGTVTKEVTIETEPVVVGEKTMSEGKFFDPALLAEAQTERGVADDESKAVPKDVVVAGPARLRENAQGGSSTPQHGMDAPASVWLLASCSDQEVSNVTRRRNSAFTEQLLRGLHEARPGSTFGWMRDFTAQRMRNTSLRYPQNPALFGVSAQQALPTVYQRVDAGRRLIADIIMGVLRRERAAKAHRKEWIADVRTLDGRTEYRDGDLLQLGVHAKPGTPNGLWACVFNVGPTGNATLIYPNMYNRGEPLTPGSVLEVGTKAKLQFQGTKGEESIVVYLLEWNPFMGFDWNGLSDASHGFLDTNKDLLSELGGDGDPVAQLVARDVGVSGPRTARPGEGWDKKILKLTHR